MKFRKWMGAMPVAFLAWVACQKEGSTAGPQGPQIVTAKSEIKKGETVTVALKNTSNNAVARWTVTPASGATIDSVYSTQVNTISFSQPGRYTIEADVRNVTSNCRPSPGWDTCYKASPTLGRVAQTVSVTN